MTGRRLFAAVLPFVFLVGCHRTQQPAASPVPSGPRPAAVAGSFYPADSKALADMVQGYLTQARRDLPTLNGERVIGILVPHAGYVYSGLTAAHAFAALQRRQYDTVILLGPPHYVSVTGAAVYCGSSFQTPLGAVPVNTSLASAIAASSPASHDDPAPHVPEHSLEVELPFLLSVLSGARIVPVLVMGNQQTLDTAAKGIIEAIRKAPGGFARTLLVISSDLAHYPSAPDARSVDKDILSAFCSLDPNRLLAADRQIMGRKVANLACSMCGLDAAYVGLQVARAAEATGARILDTRTSADSGVSGATQESVVGYGAVAITGPAVSSAPAARADWVETHAQLWEPLNAEEQRFLLQSARRSIEEYLNTSKKTEVTKIAEGTHLQEKRGCFVTLYTRSSEVERELRGCIGEHEPSISLEQLVPQLALASAFGDPRFPPLNASKLPRLIIEISVYRTPVVPIPSVDEFIVGTYGIILRVGEAEATFLPQVATEQGWDRTSTLENLCAKAGLPGDAWKRQDAKFLVYETQPFSEE